MVLSRAPGQFLDIVSEVEIQSYFMILSETAPKLAGTAPIAQLQR